MLPPQVVVITQRPTGHDACATPGAAPKSRDVAVAIASWSLHKNRPAGEPASAAEDYLQVGLRTEHNDLAATRERTPGPSTCVGSTPVPWAGHFVGTWVLRVGHRVRKLRTTVVKPALRRASASIKTDAAKDRAHVATITRKTRPQCARQDRPAVARGSNCDRCLLGDLHFPDAREYRGAGLRGSGFTGPELRSGRPGVS
jgi:hypothetical protein